MRAPSSAVPPKTTAAPSLAFFMGIVLAAAVLGSGAVLFFFNPGTHGFYPVCLFHKLTGLNCPGCGGTRAAYQLLHGHLLNALRDNALFILTLIALMVRGLGLWRAKFAISPPRWPCRQRRCGRIWFLRLPSACCGICRRFHFSPLECAELLAFAAARSRVQSLTYESDTSIDNNHV